MGTWEESGPGGGAPRGAGAGTVIGPWRVVGELGRGGMGVVYRCAQVETGAPAAVKTVTAVSQGTLNAIRGEIHALGRLRHPGVVRILGQGVAGGLPWYAMELLEGETMRDRMERSWREAGHPLREPIAGTTVPARATAPEGDLPLGLRPTLADDGRDASEPEGPTTPPPWPPGPAPPHLLPLLTVVRRLCATLSFLHGRGIVHRDLKPDNVFVRSDGNPVVVDFGVASRTGGALGHEQIEVGGRVFGSIHYIAPEQIRGEFVDARADLYALGCMLYEVVTRRPPFLGGSSDAVLASHLDDRPVAPSRLVPSVPPALDRLIVRLLEKRREDRPGHADDVAAVLEGAGAGGWDELELPRAQPCLYRPAFAGREGVLGALRAVLGQAAAGRGGCVLVGGESGVGKTRLAMEVMSDAARARIEVVAGECVALGAAGEGREVLHAAPLHPFRPLLLAIADRCRARGAGETARLAGDGGRLLASLEPELADVPGAAAWPEPPPLPPAAARARLLDRLVETLHAFTAGVPLLLVLDDLQWADELSLSLLGALVGRGFASRPLLVLGTYRAEEWSEPLRELVGAPGVHHLRLERFDAPTVRAMIAGMLALRRPPAPFVDFLWRQSSGNPFFVAEYLRSAIQQGMLQRAPGGGWRFQEQGTEARSLEESLPLPRSLVELIGARLSALGARGRALVELASVLGRDFEADLLARAAPPGDAERLDALVELRARQILEPAGANRLRFTHDKLRELTYERIEGEARRALHRRAGEAIEAHYAGAADFARHLPELAHHFAGAGLRDRAASYFARAGDRARAAYANDEAIGFYRGAIAQLEPPADAAAAGEANRLHETVGDVLELTGRHEAARDAYRRALDASGPGDRIARARRWRKTGKVWAAVHQHPEALRALDDAEQALGSAPGDGADDPWWQEWLQIQIERMNVRYWLGEADALTGLVERVRPVLDRWGSASQRSEIFQMELAAKLRRERYLLSAETVATAREALAAAEPLGDPAEVEGARFLVAFCLLFHGQHDEAEARLSELLAGAERTGHVELRARCLAYLTLIARRRGRVAEVAALAARALAAAEEAGLGDCVGAARAHRAWVALREGDLASADAESTAALETWRGLPSAYPLQANALFPLIAVRAAAGRWRDALAHARELLDPAQQRLPTGLVSALTAAAGAERDGDEAARRDLFRALAAARSLGFA